MRRDFGGKVLWPLRWRSARSAISLGTRLDRQGNTDRALRAFRRAMDSGDLHGAPAGAWWTASLLHRSGDVTGACEFYERAIKSRHPAWSLRAALNLATLREEGGDVGEACKLYEWAVDYGDPTRTDGTEIFVLRAATKLEILLTRQGKEAEARAIYDRVTQGVREQQARFAMNRATELKARGDVEGAAASLHQAIDLNHPALSDRAAAMLANLQTP